jgi:8-oxo-dGTP pyrophosphatase MutT (NUDIX family)
MLPTEQLVTNNVCTVIHRVSPATGKREMLVINVRSLNPATGTKSPWRIKFPGGGQEGPNEPIEGTRDREVWQETNLAFLKSKKIWEKQVSPTHIKHAFLVDYEDCSGQLRTEFKEENGDELQPPEWIEVEELGRRLFEGHQMIFLAAYRDLHAQGLI